MNPPVALTAAGSDSSGAAGLQADLATFCDLGVHGVCAVTVVTAQASTGVDRVEPVAVDLVGAQIDGAVADCRPAAAKTGLLWSRSIVEEVAFRLAVLGCPLVVDPVLVDSDGDPFVDDGAIDAYRRNLLPLASVATPNLPELAALLGVSLATPDDVVARADEISRLAPLVAVTGGRMGTDTAIDLLVAEGTATPVERRRVATRNVRGSGCTFSAALVAHLARGETPVDAARLAGDYAHQALERGSTWRLGEGRGPVAHLAREAPTRMR